MENVAMTLVRTLYRDLYDRRHGARGAGAKTISKSLSIPLEDVQLVLKAFKKFMQSTADQLARKAASSEKEP